MDLEGVVGLPTESVVQNQSEAALPEEVIAEHEVRAVTQASQARSPVLHIRNSFAYRIRLPLTTFCLISGAVLTAMSAPRIQVDTFLNHALILWGYAIIVAGVMLRLWSSGCISSHKSKRLITSGPYSLSRNPLYLATFLIVLGQLLIVQSLILFACMIPVIALYIWGVVPAEETVLASRHPEAFREYAAAVPRWLPTFKSYCRSHTLSFATIGFRKELECSAWWLVIAIALHLSCEFRTLPWDQYAMHWP